MKSVFTLPLYNFESDGNNEINLGNAKIIPTGNKWIYGDVIKESKYVLTLELSEDLNPQAVLDKVLTIFKLFKDCSISSNAVVIPGEAFFYNKYTYWLEEGITYPPKFSLALDEEDDFIKFWKDFFDVNADNFAVSRFNYADFNPSLRDKIVNYIESLEFMLVPDSSEGEISYKFRSRGALVLGSSNDPKNKENLFEYLKDAYSLRSAIVHGDINRENKLLKKRNLDNYIRDLRKFTSQAIKFFYIKGCLDNNDKRSKLMDKLCVFECKLGDGDTTL
jgi:hypothetical protein